MERCSNQASLQAGSPRGPRPGSSNPCRNTVSCRRSPTEQNTTKWPGQSTSSLLTKTPWPLIGSTGSRTWHLATRPSIPRPPQGNSSSVTPATPTPLWSFAQQQQPGHCSGREVESIPNPWPRVNKPPRSMSMAPMPKSCASQSRWASSITTPAHPTPLSPSPHSTPVRRQHCGPVSPSVSVMLPGS